MIAASLFIAALLSPLVTQSTKTASVFDPPIDALSITLPAANATVDVRGWDGGRWTQWFPLAVEEEFDPLLRESNLVIFPREVSRVEVRNTATTNYKLQTTNSVTLHPIRVTKDLPRILSVSLLPTPYPTDRGRAGPLPPRILSRKEWGADDSLLFAGKESQRSDLAPDNAVDAVENGNGVVPERLRECEEWQRKYPEEFRAERTVREDAAGQTYRWPLQYSPSIRLLVVHHTAQNIAGDERPPIERVRALYAYHADSRGWGDIGYHYLIDERGQIYEGRAGGEKVIGGHAYCWNTGTVSIAMLGNFDVEQPKQIQMQSLQRLLSNLAQTYGIDLGSSVRMHGKNFPPIVGHRDLLSTDCPGYYVRETLSQVREHVWKGDILAAVRFPFRFPARRADTPRSPISALVPSGASPLLTPSGITLLQGRPGMLLPFSITYRGGQSQTPQLAHIADVTADQGVFLWQERGKRFVPIRSSLQTPKKLGARETLQLRLHVRFPMKSGEYRLQIGPVRYTLLVAGKRAKATRASPSAPLPKMINSQPPISNEFSNSNDTKIPSRILPPTVPPIKIGSGNEQRVNGNIRIRLTFPSDTAIVLLPDDALINGIHPEGREILLFRDAETCTAKERGKNIASGVIRIDGHSPFAITDGKNLRRYSGILECRVIDPSTDSTSSPQAGSGQVGLTLINELPLEDYLLGLAEEPDTEPFEKQRAFAIAARSYAAHYMDGNHPGSTSLGTTTGYKKFPGMPYDGSDDPRIFQAYEGLTFAEQNPDWVHAVRSTAGKVLTKDGGILRAAYFSSDDGRTRSPAEAGWSDFPHAEVFTGKPDPWCDGKPNVGHGVGMSGCGARGQAGEGKSAEEILRYYYPGTVVQELGTGN